MVECKIAKDEISGTVPICKYCGDRLIGVRDVDVVDLEGIGHAYRFIVTCHKCTDHPIQYYYEDVDLTTRFVAKEGTEEHVLKDSKL